MTTRLLAVGDLHLEKLERVLGGLDDIGLQLQCLHDACEHALNQGIKRVVLLGDIFETPHPRQRTVRRFLEVLHNYQHLEFHLIRGNHDFNNVRENSLELLDFVSQLQAMRNVSLHLSPTTQTWDGIRVCFLSFPYLKPVKSSRPQLVFAHQELAGALRDNGTVIAKDEDQLRIKPDTGNYWIIGHLHRKQSGKRYYYPGTMMQMNFGEPLPKGFLEAVVRTEGKQLKARTKWIKYQPPFKLINLSISDASELKKIKSRSEYRYKIVLTPEAQLPLNWRNDYPNVVNIIGTRTAKQVQQELVGKSSLAPNSTKELDITRNLSSFLKARGFSSQDRRYGRDLIRQLLDRK